ncbi:hypothetical protein LSAT2_028367 [Lamellibrachia satsuma]|nr:hypothetical protein LSAT2_028367 [Lamellibrachia satsuma]
MKFVIVQLLLLAIIVNNASFSRFDITEYLACSDTCKQHYSGCVTGSREHWSRHVRINMKKVCETMFQSCIQECKDESLPIIPRAKDHRWTLPSGRVTRTNNTDS